MVRSIYFIVAVRCLVTVVGVIVVRALIHFFLPKLAWIRRPKNYRERVLVRYQGKDFGAWMFAWFKTGLDAMFHELPEFLKPLPGVRNFLDLGCGFGIAGCLLLEIFENSQAYAIDPSAHRVDAAAAAMGDRGHLFRGAAPDFEQAEFPEHFDAVFALDMIHYLSDAELDLTLKRLRTRLNDGNYLIIRSPVAPVASGSLKMKVSQIYSRLARVSWMLRTVDQVNERIAKAGFVVAQSKLSGTNPELFWFIATASAVKMVPGGQGDEHQQSNQVPADQFDAVNAKKFVELLQPTNPA